MGLASHADRLIVVVALAGLASGCVTLERELGARALHPPASFVCPDGAPVKILVDAACRRGVCGWTCEPHRW